MGFHAILISHCKHYKCSHNSECSEYAVHVTYLALYLFVCRVPGVLIVRMFELGSRLAHMYLSSGPGEPSGSMKSSSLPAAPVGLELAKNTEEKIPTSQEFLQHVRSVHL